MATQSYISYISCYQQNAAQQLREELIHSSRENQN